MEALIHIFPFCLHKSRNKKDDSINLVDDDQDSESSSSGSAHNDSDSSRLAIHSIHCSNSYKTPTTNNQFMCIYLVGSSGSFKDSSSSHEQTQSSTSTDENNSPGYPEEPSPGCSETV